MPPVNTTTADRPEINVALAEPPKVQDETAAGRLPDSSRHRFRDYQRRFKAQQAGDPVEGEELASAEFSRRRSGRGRARPAGELLRSFWQLLGVHRGTVVGAMLLLSVATVCGLAPPAATKLLIDNVLGDEPLPAWIAELIGSEPSRKMLLVWVSVGVFFVSMLKLGFGLTGRWMATRTTKLLQMSVRKRVWEHAVRLPMNKVHELRSGSVASLLREDAGSVGELVFGLLYNPWRAIIQLIGSLIILAWVDWRLLIGAIAVLPAVWFTNRTWIARIRPRFRDVRSRRSEIDAQSTEIVGGMRVVRAFGRQRTETSRVMNGNHLMGRQELSVWWWQRTIELVWAILIPLSSGLLMLYGGFQVLEGRITAGDLVMFLVYLLMLLEPLSILAESAAAFQNSLSGLDRVLDLLAETKESEGGESLERGAVAGQVTLEDVRFRYSDDGDWAVDGVSLDVRPGQAVALVGSSGAGKTTLCNLVARFYDPTAGRILLDGRDLRDYDIESYRPLLGVVEQDVFLFDGTVAENIAYGRRTATMADVREAAQLAYAAEFIDRLPEGYDTLIGERGVKLSGGQRQRLAIARAILADPRILILDEATSNLDSESERFIQRGLETLLADRTSFVIAHRLSTVRDCDLIVVLSEGRVVEQGTHDALMQAGGRYSEMVDLQSFEAEPEFA